jgi:putative hemolysin
VKDVMTKRQDIVAVDIKCSYEQIKKVFIEEQFSRIPVYDEDIDNIVGMLYVKDLFYYNDGKNFKMKNIFVMFIILLRVSLINPCIFQYAEK